MHKDGNRRNGAATLRGHRGEFLALCGGLSPVIKGVIQGRASLNSDLRTKGLMGWVSPVFVMFEFLPSDL